MRYRLLVVFAFLLVLVSCEKDEHKIYYENGTAPVLTASVTGPLVLTQADAAKPAIRFSWTNPDYRFTTGVSSQDVTYVLQIDSVGKGFSSTKLQEVSIAKSLETTFTAKDFNAIFTKMDVKENVEHEFEFRLKSTLGNGAVPLFSNIIKMKVTPYLDVAVPIPPTGELYVTGSAMPSDWTNSPPASQKFTKVSNTEYTITVPLASGKEYKFLSTPGSWQPQYGGTQALGGDLGFNMGLPGQSDPGGIPTPAEAGNYKITVNFKTGKYTVVKQ